jgi:hypothetical protein
MSAHVSDSGKKMTHRGRRGGRAGLCTRGGRVARGTRGGCRGTRGGVVGVVATTLALPTIGARCEVEDRRASPPVPICHKSWDVTDKMRAVTAYQAVIPDWAWLPSSSSSALTLSSSSSSDSYADFPLTDSSPFLDPFENMCSFQASRN